MGLVVAIVAVVLLDLSVNSYLGHEEIVALHSNLPSITQVVDQPDLIRSPLAAIPDEVERVISSPMTFSTRPRFPIREKIYQRPQSKIALPATTVAFAHQPAIDCQTVTYPFVGEYFLVRVTDGTGCLTSVTARFRSDRLVAKAFGLKGPRKPPLR